jgi:hypothetical protein
MAPHDHDPAARQQQNLCDQKSQFPIADNKHLLVRLKLDLLPDA